MSYWLRQRNIEPNETLVAKILERAKGSSTLLTDEEILEVVTAHGVSVPS